MRKMIHVILLSILTLFQAIACDSGGSGDPDLRGKWNGSAVFPNSPFPLAIHFKVDIDSTDISGTGTFQLASTNTFRTTEFVVTGTYDYPNVTLRFSSEPDRVDIFTGTVDEDGIVINGDVELQKLQLPELSRSSRILNALGGSAELIFFRASEE
jgi:hypothetical protein